MNALISSALWNEKFFCVFRTFWIAEGKCRGFEDCMQGGWVVFSLFYAEKHISRGKEKLYNAEIKLKILFGSRIKECFAVFV